MEPLEQLIQGCVKKERQSQSRLYASFAPQMFIVCQRYSKNREEAEEILQEGFMKAFEFIHQYTFAGSFEGWLRKIMVNCALQKYRRKAKLYPVIHIESTNTEPAAPEDIISQLGMKELIKIVQDLPPAYRLVFNLYVFEGMKHKEIAEFLGISEGTSKSNLSDARAILQKNVIKGLSIAKKKVNSL